MYRQSGYTSSDSWRLLMVGLYSWYNYLLGSEFILERFKFFDESDDPLSAIRYQSSK